MCMPRFFLIIFGLNLFVLKLYPQDTLVLKSGLHLLVTIQEQNDDFVLFEEEGEAKRIPKSEVEKISKGLHIEGNQIIIGNDVAIPAELVERLRGIKFCDLGLSKEEVDLVINNPRDPEIAILLKFSEFLKEDLNIKDVIATETQRNQSAELSSSACDYVMSKLFIGEFISDFLAVGRYPCYMEFLFCDGKTFRKEFFVNVNGNTNLPRKFRNEFSKVLTISNGYNENYKLSLPPSENIMNEAEIITLLANDSTEWYEGIFELFSSSMKTSKYKLAIINGDNNINLIYLSGAKFSDDWKEGDLKGILTPTMSKNDFQCSWIDLFKNLQDASISFIDENSFTMNDQGGDRIDKYIRIR